MSENHMATAVKSRGAAIFEGREKNAKDPDVPNRTKVVRLIVVPDELKPADKDAIRAFAQGHHAARVDVFVVKQETKTGVQWVPMSWLGEALEDHHDAAALHGESVLVLMVEDREQVQWESNMPFKITKIAAKDSDLFPSTAKKREMPFSDDVIGQLGGPGRPVISGPPKFDRALYDQLYKVSFSMDLPGSGWTDVDPDIYCDWN